MAKTFYGYQRLKRNAWFEEQFLPSFQPGCQQISERQFRIFEKYLIEDSENWRSNNIEYWRGIVNGFCVTASRHSVWNGTKYNSNGRTWMTRKVYEVRIAIDPTEEILKVSEELEELKKVLDAAYDDESVSDDELDKLEDKESELINKKWKLVESMKGR